MRVKTVFLGAAAAIAVSAPIVAQAADASRAAASVAGENALGYSEDGSASQLIVLALVVGVIIGGIFLFDEDEDDDPVSA